MTQAENSSNGLLQTLTRAFRSRNYRLFFGGQLVSLVGTFLTQLATILLVYRLSNHDARWLGIVGFSAQVPMFLLAPFAGVWVDRWNRRRMLVITQTLAMLESFALAALAFSSVINVEWVVVLAAVQGMINAFDIPGRQAFLVEMVENRDDLANAIALNSTMVHGARIIGPALAGLLVYKFGEGICFLLDGCSYIGVIAALLAMRLVTVVHHPSGRSVLRELGDGFNYVWNTKHIRSLLITMSVMSLTAMPALTLLVPVFGEGLGHGNGPQMTGFLMACSGGGALVSAIFLAARKTVVGLGRVMAWAAAVFGVSVVAFGLSNHLWLSLLIMPFAGFGALASFASANTLLQTLADDEKRGRVMSFFTLAFIGMTPWGNLLAGECAKRLGDGMLGASRTLIIMGGVGVLTAIAFAIHLPALRRMVRPIYIKKGILPAVAQGVNAAAQLAETTYEP